MTLAQYIHDVFHIESAHQESPNIRQYPFPEEWGTGSLQIIRLGCYAAIIMFDGCFTRNFTYHIQDDELLHIAYYREIFSSHHCPHTCRPMGADAFYAHIGLSGHLQTDYQLGTPVKSVHIFLSPEYYDGYLSAKVPNAGTQIRNALSIIENIEFFPELTFIFHQLYDYQNSCCGDFLFYESKINEILARMLQKCLDAPELPLRQIKQADMEAVHVIAEYIRTHTAQETPLCELAHMACMSPAKLKYVFKAAFNCSVREYRLQNRVHVAKEMLYHTDLPIAEIAAQLGYQNSGNFSSLFKRYTGFLPKAFRDYSRMHPHHTDFSRQ